MRSLEELYSELGACISRSAPEPWRCIRMEAEVLDDWSEAQYFILEPNVHTSFLPTSAVGVRISDALIEMRKLMSAEGKTPWNKIRFTLQRDGKFHVDYSYDPGIENE